MVTFCGEALGELAGVASASATEPAEQHHHDPEGECGCHPARAESDVCLLGESDSEGEGAERAEVDECDTRARESQQQRDLARPLAAKRRDLGHSGHDGTADEEKCGDEMQEEQRLRHWSGAYALGRRSAPSASASSFTWRSTRRWIRWISASDHSCQYRLGHMRLRYHVVPSSRVRPSGSCRRRNWPRTERRKPSRWGGWMP